MRKNQFLTLALSAVFLMACNIDDQTEDNSSDSEKMKDPNSYTSEKREQKGNSSFVVSGELEGEYSGVAYFRPFERNGLHSWGITLIDQKPMTFTVSFAQTSSEPISAPEEGLYTLGINPGNRKDDIYSTSFEYFESDPLKRESYSVGFGETSGVLEITKSTEELIEGTFAFSAVRLEKGMVAGTIEVTEGKFSAVITR
ncbi:MAG: hypothetical protein WEA99_04675 [Brumimicrobium sp.]